MFGSLDLIDRRMPDEMADLHRYLLLAIVDSKADWRVCRGTFTDYITNELSFWLLGQYLHEYLLSPMSFRT
ncbi:hypothetical protein ASD02_25225 [Ensifer sp. Root1252]|nr:hypothetical protein ASD02_25225 [Ensifer sp. Root1252]KRC79332.1 hypothetical protein ASE32_25765 [Ensifer sp. Root231]KRC99724.1 hypothetical protein ASE47_26125 [Ensifer sp. Root258]